MSALARDLYVRYRALPQISAYTAILASHIADLTELGATGGPQLPDHPPVNAMYAEPRGERTQNGGLQVIWGL